jgi:aminoglycoside phosphotransferase (APT) family kinase protein
MELPDVATSPLAGDGQRRSTLHDVVDRWEDAQRLGTAPLIVRERLRDALQLSAVPDVTRIDAGHSNPTFLVTNGDARWVLRRPPRPPFARTAHDVLREHRILTALRDEPVRTPLPVVAVEDPAVMGAPFYAMEALDGVVLRDEAVAPLDTPAERNRGGENLVDALAELHAVDPVRIGLGDEARGRRYVERQVALWSGQWEKNQTRRIAALDEVTRQLRRDLPVTQRVAVVHGDYKLDNVMFARDTPARVIAILDWEMATIGDPLADVGFLSATWIDAGEEPNRLGGLCRATMQPGFPTRRQLVARYAQHTELDLEQLSAYQAMALWKLAILLEGSYRRYLAGTASDPFFVTLDTVVPLIAEQALAALQGAF